MTPQPIEPSSTHQTTEPTSTHSSRCRHYTLHGRQCRLHALNGHNGLCFRDSALSSAALLRSPNDSADLSADLLPELSEFSSGADIRQFLARLLVQVTKGRVGPRRAAVLAYITNQLLHSHRAIQKESDDEPQQIIFDLPRPKRD
jgi:hypothetical protein